MNITAHSGCDGTPENSLESIEAGIAFGADIVEVDVRYDKKGILILAHDADPNKEYLNNESLSRAFDIIAANEKIAVNCDIKEAPAIPAVLELAGEKGIDCKRLILTGSVTPFNLEENPKILSKATVWINIEECLRHFCDTGNKVVKPFQDLIMNQPETEKLLRSLTPHSAPLIEEVLAGCLAWGVKVLNMPYIENVAETVTRIKNAGIGTSVWTVNEEEVLKQLLGLGVLSVTTRNVRLAAKARMGF